MNLGNFHLVNSTNVQFGHCDSVFYPGVNHVQIQIFDFTGTVGKNLRVPRNSSEWCTDVLKFCLGLEESETNELTHSIIGKRSGWSVVKVKDKTKNPWGSVLREAKFLVCPPYHYTIGGKSRYVINTLVEKIFTHLTPGLSNPLYRQSLFRPYVWV